MPDKTKKQLDDSTLVRRFHGVMIATMFGALLLTLLLTIFGGGRS